MNSHVCSANLFYKSRTRKDLAAVQEILGRFKVEDKDLGTSSSQSLKLQGYSLAEIREYLLEPIVKFLDPCKTSSIYHMDAEGRLETIQIYNSQFCN